MSPLYDDNRSVGDGDDDDDNDDDDNDDTCMKLPLWQWGNCGSTHIPQLGVCQDYIIIIIILIIVIIMLIMIIMFYYVIE